MDHADHVALIRGGVEGAGPRWLELGAGEGAFTLALADVLGAGAQIVAVDKDRRALETMAARVGRPVPGRRRRDAGRRLHADPASRTVRRRPRGQQRPLRPQARRRPGGDPRRPRAGRPVRPRGVRRGPRQPVGPAPDLVRDVAAPRAGRRLRRAAPDPPRAEPVPERDLRRPSPSDLGRHPRSRRVERHPAIAREVDLDPGVRRPFLTVSTLPTRSPGRNPSTSRVGIGLSGIRRPQQHRHRRRVMEAVAAPGAREALDVARAVAVEVGDVRVVVVHGLVARILTISMARS